LHLRRTLWRTCRYFSVVAVMRSSRRVCTGPR
jgi:hypothetical protein